MHEFAFQVIGQVTSVLRHQLMDFMFADPTMLDDLDFLFKSDMARSLIFYHQEEWKPEPTDKSKLSSKEAKDEMCRPNMMRMQAKDKHGGTGGKKTLTVQDGSELPLNGISVYTLRSSSKRALGEETFQREIMMGRRPGDRSGVSNKMFIYQGMVDARLPENLLWNIERIVTNIFIPILNSSALGGSEDLQIKVKNELLPCLRSFTRSVWIFQS